MALGLQLGLGLAARAAAAASITAPAVSGPLATQTIAEGVGTVTIQTADRFTGGGLTYALEDQLSGYAIPGMSINSANGVITCTRSALRRGLRYLRVTATNGLGSAVLDFNVFVRFQTFDYTVTDTTSWNAVWANSDATLAGKVIAIDANTATTWNVPSGRAPASAIIITTASHSARIHRLTFNGGGPFRLDGAIVYNDSGPTDTPIIYANSSTGTTLLDQVNSDIAHNYYGGILDPNFAYPEFAKSPTPYSATTTSQRLALTVRDPAMPQGTVEFSNTGANTAYVRIGNSTVTATTSDTAVAPGATVDLQFGGTVPTHFAFITATGTTTGVASSEQGLIRYVRNAYGAGGGASFEGSVIGCAIHDVQDGIKGYLALVADNNDIFRTYQDNISINGNRQNGRTQYITRNRLGLPFASASHAENPHADFLQMYLEGMPDDGTQAARNIILAGNFGYRQTGGATVSQIFLSDHNGGYRDVVAIGNANLSAANAGLEVGEDASPSNSVEDFALDGMAYANTIVNAADPTATNATVRMKSNLSNPTWVGWNIAGSFDGATLVNNSTANTVGSIDTLLPNRAALNAARSFKAAFAAYAASVNAGARWAVDTGVIDLQAADHTSVVNWTLVPPGFAWPSLVDQVEGATVTSAWRKVKGGGGTVTPGSGTEWQSSSDGGTTIVQDWTTSAGTIARGHSIRVRRAASTTPEATVQATVTINSFTQSCNITTRAAVTANFVGRTTLTSPDMTNPLVLSLTGLTGGLGSAPIENDLVILFVSSCNTTTRTITFPGDWTPAGAVFVNGAGRDLNARVAWKVMTATPDTSVSITTSGVSGNPTGVGAIVLRGCNTTNPFEVGKGPTAATNTAGRVPNPPSQTPTGPNAMIFVCGASALAATPSQLDAPYLFNKTPLLQGTGIAISAVMGVVPWTSGAYDPAAMTIGGTSTSNDTAAGWTGVISLV